MKSMTKLMIVAMVLVAALVVAPATAARTISTNGANVFIGEEDLNFTYNVPAGETVNQWVHYSDPSAGTIDKTVSATNGIISELNSGIPTGSYYVFTNGASADPSNRSSAIGYVNVQSPSVTLDVVLNTSQKDSVNGKTVTRDALLDFKVTDNLNGLTGATLNVEVTLPGGGVTTDFGGQTLKGVTADGTTLYLGAINLTDISAGTYTAQAKWPSASDFYGKGYDSNTVTFEVATKALSITSNKDTVVRGNAFTVTITGESKQTYHLFVKSPLSTLNENPLIAPGQNGVQTTYDATNVTVQTSASGTRSIQFNTSQDTKDQSFTIRVQKDGTTTYDEVKVRIEKGAVTATVSGTGVYYLGEEISLSGTNTDSDMVYLFMTGPNLNSAGVNLNDPSQKVTTGDANNFTTQDVETDDTWTYKWDTSETISNRNLDAGGYTIYAASADVDKNDLSNAQYDTISIQLRSAFVTATTSGATVAKGDDLTISGTAQGNPASVRIWVFGKNYYGGTDGTLDYITATVESDGSFEEKLDNTEDLSAGQYFVVIQHPMGSTFGVDANSTFIFGTDGGIVDTKLTSLQASEAATALIDALDSPNIPDTYVKLTFVVEEPNIFIDAIGDQTAGSKFTITGTTNLAVGDKLNVEVTSAAFQPSTKTESSGFSNVAGTAVVQAGEGTNTWSYEVDAASFEPDQYIVTIESIDTDSTQTATFHVIEGGVTTAPTGTTTVAPTGTTTTVTTAPTTAATPTQSPGFGALVALAGLGAVAFLVLRRN